MLNFEGYAAGGAKMDQKETIYIATLV